MKRALITGCTGQDGSYLAELLLEKGYEVHGFVRRVALEDQAMRCNRLMSLGKIELHAGDITDYASVVRAVMDSKPDECYHLAAQSFVKLSFDSEFETMRTNVDGTMYILAALQKFAPECRFYFAGSSEMFGKVDQSPQNEYTPFHPRSPYGISKVAGFDLTRYYREAYDMFACSGILFNHESPRRGHEFVTRKITSAVAKIKRGMETELRLGNLDARRDWGYAKEYVEAMWAMLQLPEPVDLVIATGQSHSIKDFVKRAFEIVSLNYEDYVKTDPEFYRPADVHTLCGDYCKARSVIGWLPETKFDDLVEMMVKADMGWGKE